MRECLNVLMLEWLARSNQSSNQAIRQSSNLFNLSTDNEKCGSNFQLSTFNFQLSNNQTFKQSNNQKDSVSRWRRCRKRHPNVENVNLRPASARELSCFFLKKKLPFDKKNVYLFFQKSIHIAQERRLKHTIFNDLPDYKG